MIAATRRVIPRAAISLASLSAAAFGELLEFRAAFGSAPPPGAGGSSSFTSVEAFPITDLTEPARAYAGGFFTGVFQFGAQGPLVSPNGEDGVLAGLSRDPAAGAWNIDWLLQAPSDGGNARLNDVALAASGEIFVTGTFQGDVTFGAITLNTAPGGGPEGFVAVAEVIVVDDRPVGRWNNAFQVPDMQPNSLTVDREGAIYLTGPPILARCYDPAGAELWSTPQPPEVTSLRHIAVEFFGQPGENVYVNGEAQVVGPGGTQSQDVFVTQLDRGDGGIRGTTFISSPGEERAGGLGVGPLGRIRASFSSDDSRNVTVSGRAIQDLPPVAGRHSHLLFLAPNGNLIGDNLLGTSVDQGGTMDTADLALDAAGNSYVAVSFNGPFEFEGIPHPGQEDAAVVAIDAAGTPIRFSDSMGGALARGNAVAAANRNLQILVGDLQGIGPEQFGGTGLPADAEESAYFAALEPVAGQQAFILVSTLGEELDSMIQHVNDQGGEIYRTLDLPNERIRFVSAFLTPEQVEQLRAVLEPFEDRELFLDGTVSPSGYALEALNKAPASNPYSYTFPETCHSTVLYLIDSAIDNSSGYFDGNPNLTFGPSTLVREIGDPLVSTKFDHGTEMLSMIAGPTYGAAQGTPITVINYDIYPDGVSARLSALVEAIGLANSDKALNYPFDPAVYCVASSATSPGNSTPTLKSAVDYAVGSAVYASVIVSAGNTNGLAEDYTPSDLGSKSGVLCAGAIDSSNAQVALTRGGSAVDLWAPGEAVAAADTSGLPTTLTGTSASTALTAGAALIYLSANPVATPVDLETALVTTHAQSDSIGQIVHVPVSGAPGFVSFGNWGSWFGLSDSSTAGNDDGDVWTNEEEYVWGLDPLAIDYQGSLVTLSYNHSTSTLTFAFPLSCQLYQPSALSAPHTLRDGSTLSIWRSDNLEPESWTDITSTLTIVEAGHTDGQMTLSFDYVINASRCFFQVRVQ